MPRKQDQTDIADRERGGPGSETNTRRPVPSEHRPPEPGEPTSSDRSRVSGGGGERDRHHTHDPSKKR
jgi:hypothetical protein